MDPVSIAGAVGPALKALYSVTTTLYTFITSAKKVDQSLENLQSEVRGLTRVLEDIEKFLKDVIITQTRNTMPGIDGAWGPIYNAIQDTQHTIKALQKVLGSLGSPSEVTNGFKKTVKQIQLNINLEEISNIRSRIQWHSTSLRMYNPEFLPSIQALFWFVTASNASSVPPLRFLYNISNTKVCRRRTMLNSRSLQNWRFKWLLCESHHPKCLQIMLSR